MKKLTSFIVLFISTLFVFAQSNSNHLKSDKSSEIKDVKNIIKLNIGEIFSNTVSLHYERMLTDNISVSLGVIGKYNSASSSMGFGSSAYSQSVTTSGLGFMPEVRFYPIPDYHAPRGMYVGAFYNYYNETYEEIGKANDPNTGLLVDSKGSVKSTFSSKGLTLGWLFRIKSSFVIDLAFGGGFQTIETPLTYDYRTNSGTVLQTKTSPNSPETKLNGLFRFSLGYAF
ncbi:MAG: hypothetical protein NTU43_09200 [Bacteroidetes bacterium]|nr:hypothetical protein [Bacteroidota bacterium]